MIDLDETFVDDKPVFDWNAIPEPPRHWRQPAPVKLTTREVTRLGLIGALLAFAVAPLLGLVFIWMN